MREEYMTSQEIIQEIADLKIRLALQLEFEQEVEEILASPPPDENEMQAIQNMEAKVLNTLAQRKSHPAVRRSHSFPKVGRILAIALLLILVSIGSAFATAHMIQIGLLKLDVQTYPDYTSYSLIPSGETIDVPAEWEGSFYPTYIPDGFVLYDCVFKIANYITENNKTLTFTENSYGSSTSFDTENAIISTVEVNGIEATLIEKNGWVAVIWTAHNRFFSVDIDGSVEEALTVANSVVMIP